MLFKVDIIVKKINSYLSIDINYSHTYELTILVKLAANLYAKVLVSPVHHPIKQLRIPAY